MKRFSLLLIAATCFGQGTPDTFLRLRDTPSSYASQALKFVRVNAAANALEFTSASGGGATVFTGLGDVPASYVGSSLKIVRVNAGETGLEFATSTSGVPTTRILTIGGTAQDLSSDRSWLANVTNDAQTKAAIVPNTAPTSGQILIGNAGNTAYAKQTLSGSGATATLSSSGVLTLSNIANASLSNGAVANLSGTNTGDQVVPVNTTSTASQWFAAYNSTTGAFTKSQPTFTDLSAHPTTIAGYGITDFNSLGDARWQPLDADLTSWASITRASGIDTFVTTPTSANLRATLTDENGTGAALFNGATTPDFTTGFTIGAAAASGKIPIGNGTNYVPSTPTYPNASGAAGYVVRSDATNFASFPTNLSNASVSNQTLSTSDAYITGSDITVTAGDFKAKGQYRCVITGAKTAGTGAIVISLRVGTLGTTGDAAILTFTFGAGTSVSDTATFVIAATFRTVGSGTAAVMEGVCQGQHNLATTGFFNNAASFSIINGPSSGFNSSTATKIGVSVNGSTAFAGTINLVQATLDQT